MSGMGKSLVQHGPNTYCVLGTVEEEKVTGDLVPAFGSSGPWGGWYANNAVTNALGHCIPGALGALPTHPPSQWELGALGGNGGEGMEGRDCAAKPGALDTLGSSTTPRHIRGGG